jgi:hypothetical protein
MKKVFEQDKIPGLFGSYPLALGKSQFYHVSTGGEEKHLFKE